MALKLITAPDAPVTIAEAKDHCNVSHTGDDANIAAYILAATNNLDGKDGILGRALMPQTWELQYDAFPCGFLRIPLPPLQSITSIKYIDTDGVEQTLDSLEYVVDTASEPGGVAPVTSWPSTYPTLNAVKVRFVAGYATVPSALKVAIMMMVADMLENREGAIVAVSRVDNPTVERLTFPYRVLTV